MLERGRKMLGLAVAGLMLAGAVVYFVRDPPAPAAQRSTEERAAEIARHREAQRAQVPAPATRAESTAAARDKAPPTATPAAPSAVVAAPYWTDFRGPQRDGHYRERPIRTSWSSGGLKPLWKQPVGGGHASFAVANGRAFTIEQRGKQEVVAAYDVASGRELWTNGSTTAFFEAYGGDGPRATPAWHEGRVFALGANGELRALDDARGQVIWRTNILQDAGAPNITWGVSASPLVVGDHVIVIPGGNGGNSVVAYERSTGRRAWGAHDDRASYSSPMHVRLAGAEQILVFTATRLAGLSPDGGRLLWEFPWTTQGDVNASQPLVIGDNRVFISTGYGVGAALIEVSRDGDRFAVRQVWRTNRMKNQFTSSVHHDGFIYGLDESILACLDAASGELKWKGGRYGFGQVMLADGHLIVLTDSGELALVRASPERHIEIVRFPVLQGRTWNHPAMADGHLLIRNINEMAAFDLRRD